jgi:hypothetical protein
MQRTGYLKRLIKRVTTTPTSNLESLGNDLLETVLKRVRIQIDENLATYIKARLGGNSYTSIKSQTNAWLKNGGSAPFLLLELQDLYLSNPKLPSQVGRLVKEDWRKYPQLGMNIGLIRSGTYSPTTRAFSFLNLVPEQELQAFIDYKPEANPFLLSLEQRLFLIYLFLENDGAILVPLWKKLLTSSESSFSERDAGDLLPPIIRNIISYYKNKLIPVGLRKRLESLGKSADNIALQLNVQDYKSVSAREENARVRIEPIVDLGILQKVNPLRYEYTFSAAGKALADSFTGDEDSTAIGEFLNQRFFTTMAAAQGIQAEILSEEDIIPRLRGNWKTISSSNGYAPIEEIALLASIKALVNDNKILEIATARDALIAFQKANPYQVRFTVDRLGTLAHAKFIDDSTR